MVIYPRYYRPHYNNCGEWLLFIIHAYAYGEYLDNENVYAIKMYAHVDECAVLEHAEFHEQRWPKVADLNHTADAIKFSAGSVTAALFLEHFAGERNWVHLDIAGPGRSDSDSGEYPKGGTGFGVRLLLDWIAGLA